MKPCHYLITLSTLLLSSITFANTTNFNAFLPKNFTLLETHCQADFNKDNKKDCVLLIKDTQKSAWQQDINNRLVDRNRQGIVILLKTKTGYKKALENKSLLESENEDGGIYYAPELEIITKNNKLILKYLHGRYGHWSFTFDYRTIDNKQDFYLIGYDSVIANGAYIKYTNSINFLTHKLQRQTNTNKDEQSDSTKFKTTWHNFPKDTPLRLSQIDDLHEVYETLNNQIYALTKKDD